MAELSETKQDKIARRQVDKFQARRTELAAATLHTLADLGYARTSLREIAQNSEFSHGVLHYYFVNKWDLIAEAAGQYEGECVTRYDGLIADATTPAGLLDGFVDTFFTTLKNDAPLHRLWYDLRNQSLFDVSFRTDVQAIDARRQAMIWRVVSRYAELSGVEPAATPIAAYAVLDGIFLTGLRHLFAGMHEQVAQLEAELPRVFMQLVSAG